MFNKGKSQKVTQGNGKKQKDTRKGRDGEETKRDKEREGKNFEGRMKSAEVKQCNYRQTD